MHFKSIVALVEEAVNLQSLRLEYGQDAIPPTLPD